MGELCAIMCELCGCLWVIVCVSCVCGGKRVYDLCINECLWVNCVCVCGGDVCVSVGKCVFELCVSVGNCMCV